MCHTFREEAFSAVHEGCAPKSVSVKMCPCISVCHKARCDFPKQPFLSPDACPPGRVCPSLLALLPSPVINVPLSHTVLLAVGGREEPRESCTHCSQSSKLSTQSHSGLKKWAQKRRDREVKRKEKRDTHIIIMKHSRQRWCIILPQMTSH